MNPRYSALALLCAAGLATAQPQPRAQLRILLVGDSTMQARTGYGDVFCAQMASHVECLNLAKGGRSTSSFRAEGRWAQVRDLLQGSGSEVPTWVLIQFGHNDQPGKPGRSTDLATEFPVNMTRYVSEVKALGAVPVVFTPLTRRSFNSTDATLKNDLRPWAEASLRVAASEGVPSLDLNLLSHAAVQAMGEEEADTLAMAPKPVVAAGVPAASTAERAGAANPVFDRTHLGPKGAQVFSVMVEKGLKQAVPAMAPSFKSE